MPDNLSTIWVAFAASQPNASTSREIRSALSFVVPPHSLGMTVSPLTGQVGGQDVQSSRPARSSLSPWGVRPFRWLVHLVREAEWSGGPAGCAIPCPTRQFQPDLV